MMALERSLLRGFLSAAGSLEWKQGELAAAGEGRSRPGAGRVRGRYCGYAEPPVSPPASGSVGAVAGGSLRPRGSRVPASRPFCALLRSGGLLPAPPSAGGPVGSSVWRRASGTAGRAAPRRGKRPPRQDTPQGLSAPTCWPDRASGGEAADGVVPCRLSRGFSHAVSFDCFMTHE